MTLRPIICLIKAEIGPFSCAKNRAFETSCHALKSPLFCSSRRDYIAWPLILFFSFVPQFAIFFNKVFSYVNSSRKESLSCMHPNVKSVKIRRFFPISLLEITYAYRHRPIEVSPWKLFTLVFIYFFINREVDIGLACKIGVFF